MVSSDEKRLLETLVGLLQKSSQSADSGKSSSFRLVKTPGCPDHMLPSAKEWQQWYDVKFRSWAGAQAPGCAGAVDVFLKAGLDTVLST